MTIKKFFLNHIFKLPTNYDSKSLLSSICGLIVVLSWISGCGPTKEELEAKNRAKNEMYEANPAISEEDFVEVDNIKVQVIDSCEYIIYGAGFSNKGCIIHKANCRNPVHQIRK